MNLQEVPVSAEQITPFSAVLAGDSVRVSDKDRFVELEGSGYGSREGNELVLRDHEALYLLYVKKLELLDKAEKKVSFESGQRVVDWSKWEPMEMGVPRLVVDTRDDLRPSFEEIVAWVRFATAG